MWFLCDFFGIMRWFRQVTCYTVTGVTFRPFWTLRVTAELTEIVLMLTICVISATSHPFTTSREILHEDPGSKHPHLHQFLSSLHLLFQLHLVIRQVWSYKLLLTTIWMCFTDLLVVSFVVLFQVSWLLVVSIKYRAFISSNWFQGSYFIKYVYKCSIKIINNYLLLNVQFGSLLGLRGLLLIYMWGENSI